MSTQQTQHSVENNEKADLIRAALLAYAERTIGRERSLAERLAMQAEEMAEAAQ